MCGRFSLSQKLAEIAAEFKAQISDSGLWDWEPNYNIAPATIIPVMAHDGKRQRKIVPMRWGLHPHWKKEPPEGRPLFNARIETAHEKASFRTPFQRRRALIPAHAWYEWEGVEKPKTPYAIAPKDGGIFCFAGLWDQWRVDEGVTLLSCTILTTAAKGPIKHLHHRMPIRLPQNLWEDWLNWDVKAGDVLDALPNEMKEGEDLHYWQVGTEVNSGRAQGEGLLKAI